MSDAPKICLTCGSVLSEEPSSKLVNLSVRAARLGMFIQSCHPDKTEHGTGPFVLTCAETLKHCMLEGEDLETLEWWLRSYEINEQLRNKAWELFEKCDQIESLSDRVYSKIIPSVRKECAGEGSALRQKCHDAAEEVFAAIEAEPDLFGPRHRNL